MDRSYNGDADRQEAVPSGHTAGQFGPTLCGSFLDNLTLHSELNKIFIMWC